MHWFITAPLLLVLLLFTLSNTAPVQLGFWPTDYTITLPLSVALIVGMGLAFLLGGLSVWPGSLRQRRRARLAERQVALLQAQLDAHTDAPPPTTLPALPALDV